jgi:ribosomal protein L3 glutamine methyltransferase
LENTLITLRDYARFAASAFNQAKLAFGHGTNNSGDEAIRLVLSAVHLPPDSPIHNMLDAKLTMEERKTILALIQQRIETRKPLAYLTHEAWLGGLSFYVDERVLVPRSPIVELIDKAFDPWIDPRQIKKVLDLCTGSGSLAVIMALTFEDIVIDAVDISRDALAVAKVNVERYELQDVVRLVESDLFSAIPRQTYDLILSNPPYVSQAEYQTLPPEYGHEGCARERCGGSPRRLPGGPC